MGKIKPKLPKDSKLYIPNLSNVTKIIESKNNEYIEVIDYSQNYTHNRTDNKDCIIITGHSGRNTIRWPKKKRKNALKKFYKLFPHLELNMTHYEYRKYLNNLRTPEQILNKQPKRK